MKVLLLSNKIFHYRIPVYNYFRNSFLKKGIEFEVLADEIQDAEEQVEFPLYIHKRTYLTYRREIKKIGPDVLIFFLHLKDTSIIPLYRYCRHQNIRTIFWGHGINLNTPDSKYKQLLYDLLHKRSDAIILYSPDQLKYINSKSHNKTFIALNTIDFNSLPSIDSSKEELRKKYKLGFKTIVLFCGRVTLNKRVDILIDIFARYSDPSIGLLIVGGGLSDELMAVVDRHENMIYYGAVYEPIQVNELHKLSDMFCIPGKCGLSINMAMYWSLPVLTTNVIHAPEIYFLKSEVNGYIADDPQDLAKKIIDLADHPEQLREFSENAKRIISEEADISNMFNGFYQAVQFAAQTAIQ